MARQGSEKRIRNSTITARVEMSIKTAVRAAAGTQTDSDWLRSIVVERLGLEKSLPGVTSKKRREKLSSPENSQAGELARAIAQATGLLKLNAQAFRKEGHQQLHAETEITLKIMAAAAAKAYTLLENQLGEHE